ncbi:MAG: PIG-L family deacetylase [Nocardioides sp.]
MRRTVVSFHAHPDDETLLVGGTLAMLTAAGHRVVLVVATLGDAGLDSSPSGNPVETGLGAVRSRELSAAAAALGIDTVHVFGHADSGWLSGPPPTGAFSNLDPYLAAEALARILMLEDADVLTTYDAAGGYGHPDHIQVHRVGALAAALARTPVVLEATVDRRTLQRAVAPLRHVARLASLLPGGSTYLPALPELDRAYTAHEDITHVVDVRRHVEAKRRAMSAHVSQGGRGRTLGLFLRLPRPLARVVLGREWFRQVGRAPGSVPSGDVLDGLPGLARSSRT